MVAYEALSSSSWPCNNVIVAGDVPSSISIVLALVAEFDSAEDFAVYREHPAHTDFVRDLLGPISESRASIQFFSPD